MRIKRIKIGKMPGFPTGLKGLDDLSGNINIIAGPNGSGKSSTARLIQKLIWKEDNSRGYFVDAELTLNGQSHQINIDSPFYGHTEPGGINSQTDFSIISPVEFSSQYMLALHDLVNVKDDNLAAAIAREINGGLDLNKASSSLAYKSNIYTTGNTVYKECENCRVEVDRLRHEQEALKNREKQLSQLRDRQTKAKEAFSLSSLYEKYVLYLLACEEYEDAKQEFESFPPSIEKLRKEDYESVGKLEKQLVAIKLSIAKAENTIAASKERLASLQQLADKKVEEDVRTIADKIHLLNNLHLQSSTIDEEIGKLEIARQKALDNMDSSANTEQWKGLNLQEVKRLDEFIRKAHDITYKNNQLKQRRKQLDKQLEEENRNNHYFTSYIHIPSIVVIALLTGALFYWGAWYGLTIGILALFILLGIGFRKKKTADSIFAARKEGYLKELNNEIGISDHELEDINKEYNLIKQSVGALPHYDTFNSFYYFINNVMKWQEADLQLQQAIGKKQTVINEYKHLLDECNNTFLNINYPVASDYMTTNITLQTIREDLQLRKDLLAEISSQQSLIGQYEKERDSYEAFMREIYNRTAISFGDKDTLYQLSSRYDSYLKACEELRKATIRVEQAEKQLKVHPAFETNQIALSTITVDLAKERIHEYNLLVGELESITAEIAGIETEINSKKRANELEIALSRKESALSDLHSMLDTNLKAITGDLIVANLRKEISLNNENKIFREANRILGSITKGKYSLRLSDDGQPVFKAYDNVLEQSQDLSQISTGTRVQLLLAIRLAFISNQENNFHLPILADELLANSDDERSEAIIEALIEISKERQVFYFTAQADEVSRWKARLAKSADITFRIITLGEKQFDYNAPEIFPLSVSLIAKVPSPNGMDYKEYRQALNVPTFNLIEQSPSELHLWYLMDDVELLSNCLNQGISLWGQLDRFLTYSGTIPGIGHSLWDKLKAKIQLLEHLRELYIIGRSKKINREVLVESKAVSGKFIDEMCDLLAKRQGDPGALITALDNKELRGFQTEKKNQLRSYLIEHNYLSEEAPLDGQDILIRINAFLSNLGMDRKEAERFIGLLIT